MTPNPLAFARLLASADVSVDFDPTFLVQFVLFAAFIVVLKPLLFNPLLRVFEERERRTDGAKKEARTMDAKAGELLVEYEAELDKLKAEAGVERDRLRAETARLEANIMDQAKREVATILAQGREGIAQETAALRLDLERGRPGLAGEIASRIAGREVRP